MAFEFAEELLHCALNAVQKCNRQTNDYAKPTARLIDELGAPATPNPPAVTSGRLRRDLVHMLFENETTSLGSVSGLSSRLVPTIAAETSIP